MLGALEIIFSREVRLFAPRTVDRFFALGGLVENSWKIRRKLEANSQRAALILVGRRELEFRLEHANLAAGLGRASSCVLHNVQKGGRIFIDADRAALLLLLLLLSPPEERAS